MTIKEAEARTGLARSSIRFYEKENLIQPARDESNGYRIYTEEDIDNILKIAYLRTLGISIENIHQIMEHKIELRTVIEKQLKKLDGQIEDLEKSKSICNKMLADEEITYDGLDIEAYVPEVLDYWESNSKIFEMDSVGFIYLWGGSLAWAFIMGACALLALSVFPYLPARIPIQWSDGEASSEVGKIFIFAYPIACIVVRFLLRPYIWRWLKHNFNCSDVVSDYITNYFCFIIFSLEMFTIFFIKGIVRHVTALLLADTAVLIGILLISWRNLDIHKMKK